MEKEPYTAYQFIGLMLFSAFVLFFFTFPVSGSYFWMILIIFLLSGSILFWVLSTYTDPGYMNKHPKLQFLTLVERFDPSCLCPKCMVIWTPRSWHCNICDRCVEWFDHHCPWINNCIGTNNHGFFLTFIIFLYFYLLMITIFCTLKFESD